MTNLIAAREALADEWNGKNPGTPEEIAAFYRDTVNYDDDLEAWHESDFRKEWTAAIVAAATVSGAHRVLDIGAGRGHDLIALRTAIPEITLGAVEPNHKMREHLANEGIQAWPQLSLVPSNLRDLDLISCIDVLEHIHDPEAMLLQVIDRLKMGGIFVEATATHDVETPLHLPHLRGWDPARILDRHGFVCRENVGRLRVWQRLYDKRQDQETLILCAWRDINADTALCVQRLVQNNWRFQLHRGDALISRVRSTGVSKWLRENDGDVFLMVDSDIVFSEADANKVVALAREKKSIACGAYPVRGGSHMASRGLPGQTLIFGPTVEPCKISYAGTGFFAAHRDVCEAIAATMPLCHADQDWAMWPLFMPMVAQSPFDPTVNEYLSEDWAFCKRAAELGFETWLDPSVILSHLGQAEYNVYNMIGAVSEPPPTDIIGGAS